MIAAPAIGQVAPAFTLPRDGGATVTLAEHLGMSVVLYFYPEDDTSSCTAEARSFSDLADAFAAAGDAAALAALTTIHAEEVHHVSYGAKWFHFPCGRTDQDPKVVFLTLVQRHFHGALHTPFNREKRAIAGIPPDFCWPLAAETAPKI